MVPGHLKMVLRLPRTIFKRGRTAIKCPGTIPMSSGAKSTGPGAPHYAFRVRAISSTLPTISAAPSRLRRSGRSPKTSAPQTNANTTWR